MKPIGPDHPIDVAYHGGRVRALFRGHEIADSDGVLVLKEADYPPVFYFPRDDVEMEAMRKTDKVTHCPYKGDASYFTIYRDQKIIDNAAWSYEAPFDQMGIIAGHIAFYPEWVEFEESAPDKAAVRHVPSGGPPYADTTDPRDV